MITPGVEREVAPDELKVETDVCPLTFNEPFIVVSSFTISKESSKTDSFTLSDPRIVVITPDVAR